MENNSTRSWWERIRKGVPSLFAHQTDDDTLEVSPDVRVLAARITERLIAHKSHAELTPEQQIEWQRLHQPLSTMFSKYNMTQAYRRLDPQDDQSRRQLQSMLLGALATDVELYNQFEAAMPVPVPHWLIPEEGEAQVESTIPDGPDADAGIPSVKDAEPETPVEAIEPEPVETELSREVVLSETAEADSFAEASPSTITEDEPPSEDIPPEAVEAQPPMQELQAEATEAEQPAESTPAEEDEPLGLKYLVRELRNDPEFYRVVFALRYNNPGLFTLASKLADEPSLSSQLEKFFVKTKLGTQLIDGDPGKEK